jgi:hypothetical protein
MSAFGNEAKVFDTDLVILRQIFAFDGTTNLPISTAYVLAADGSGGTVWTDVFTNMSNQSAVVGDLPTTISSLRATDAALSTLIQTNYDSLSNAISSGVTPGGATTAELLSTSAWILDASRYISTGNLVSTTDGILSQSNNFGSQLQSTVAGLGSAGYVSTTFMSNYVSTTVNSLSDYGYVSTSQLTSSLIGLGTFGVGYVDSAQLNSTIQSLLYSNTINNYGVVTTNGVDPNRTDYFTLTQNYLSTNQFYNSNTLATLGYVSGSQLPSSLTSTVAGLATAGYVSSSQLTSSMQFLLRPIDVNRLNNATITNSIVNISSLGAITFLSSFVNSTITYAGNNGAILGYGESIDTFSFSTLSLQLDKFSSFITSNSRITIDFTPNYLFTPAVMPGGPTTAVLPLSTFVRYGPSTIGPLHETTVFAWNSNTAQSNAFQQPIKISLDGTSVVGNYASNYELVHRMPAGISAGLTPGLTDSNLTAYIASTQTYFLTVQNLSF